MITSKSRLQCIYIVYKLLLNIILYIYIILGCYTFFFSMTFISLRFTRKLPVEKMPKARLKPQGAELDVPLKLESRIRHTHMLIILVHWLKTMTGKTEIHYTVEKLIKEYGTCMSHWDSLSVYQRWPGSLNQRSALILERHSGRRDI